MGTQAIFVNEVSSSGGNYPFTLTETADKTVATALTGNNGAVMYNLTPNISGNTLVSLSFSYDAWFEYQYQKVYSGVTYTLVDVEDIVGASKTVPVGTAAISIVGTPTYSIVVTAAALSGQTISATLTPTVTLSELLPATVLDVSTP